MRFSAIVAAVGLSTTPVLAGPGVLFGLNAMVNDYNAINVSLASGDTAAQEAAITQTNTDLTNLSDDMNASPPNYGPELDFPSLISAINDQVCPDLASALAAIQSTAQGLQSNNQQISQDVYDTLTQLAVSIASVYAFIQNSPDATGVDTSTALHCLICAGSPGGCFGKKRAIAEVAARAGGATLPVTAPAS